MNNWVVGSVIDESIGLVVENSEVSYFIEVINFVSFMLFRNPTFEYFHYFRNHEFCYFCAF